MSDDTMVAESATDGPERKTFIAPGKTLFDEDRTLSGLFPATPAGPRIPRTKTVIRRRRRKRRQRLIAGSIAFFIVVLAPAGIIAALVAFFAATYSDNIRILEGNPFPTVRAAPSTLDSENILLLGSDSRTGLGDDILSGGVDERADTILLVHIPADHQNVQVMSIMRDTWVDIPGYGNGKINAALAYGGVPLVIETVERLLGSRIDHVAIADFEGFADMSTALGGVQVESPVAFDSGNMAGFAFTKGINTVRGDSALAFVRERYAFATADYQRVKNQQSFLEGVMRNLTTFEGVPDLGKYNNFLVAASSHLTVDEGLTFTELLRTGYALRDVRNNDVSFFTLPSDGTGTSEDGQSIVLMDTAAVTDIGAAMQDGTLQQYLTSNDLLNGN